VFESLKERFKMAAMEKDTRISKFINSLLKTRKLNIR
jgi:hypothetical protein